MPANRKTMLRKKARQRQIEMMLASGVRSQRDIAERLGVHEGTISRDIKEIEAYWNAIAKGETRDIWRARHHKLLDNLLTVLVPIAQGEEKTLPDGKKDTVSRKEIIAAQKGVLDILDMRAKIEGLYAPTKVDLGPDPEEVFKHMSTSEGDPVTFEKPEKDRGTSESG